MSSRRNRVQLDFSSEALARLEEMQERTEAVTRADVIRNALRLYQWYLDKMQDGYKVRLVRGKNIREVELILQT